MAGVQRWLQRSGLSSLLMKENSAAVQGLPLSFVCVPKTKRRVPVFAASGGAACAHPGAWCDRPLVPCF